MVEWLKTVDQDTFNEFLQLIKASFPNRHELLTLNVTDSRQPLAYTLTAKTCLLASLLESPDFAAAALTGERYLNFLHQSLD